jgi:hypothetical protein
LRFGIGFFGCIRSFTASPNRHATTAECPDCWLVFLVFEDATQMPRQFEWKIVLRPNGSDCSMTRPSIEAPDASVLISFGLAEFECKP